MNYQDQYNRWCNDPYFDAETRSVLLSISGNENEIKDRFYKDLAFGTGGLRGLIGNGTNRMNKYTVKKATQGLANTILKHAGQEKGVVIAYDSRHFSKEFAMQTALCLNGNGIKSYLFAEICPTPVLSFAVRELGCIAGIVITASHNPADYNGYKVYWEDGGQITSPRDQEIIEEVYKITDFNQIIDMKLDEAIHLGLFHWLDEKINDRYIEELKKLILNHESIARMARQIKIVYTPLHGTGLSLVARILSETGFTQVHFVEKQTEPDGDFPTVKSPNPEEASVFELALQKAKEVDADIVLATDPDADRLGVYVKGQNQEYIPLNGNMTGCLLAEYILSQRQKNGTLPKNGALVSTIVSTSMAKSIALKYGVKYIETLTGFKYIGEQIHLFEQNRSYEFLFGFEESYGCLVGTHARDKDAIVAVMMLCEAAAYYASQGITLNEQLIRMYEEYGFYQEHLSSITLPGAEGSEKIKELLKKLRYDPPPTIAGMNVSQVRDYHNDEVTSFKDKSKYPTGLPKSDALYFEFENDFWCCIRPSGTEPKLKFYMGAKDCCMDSAKQHLTKMYNFLSELI